MQRVNSEEVDKALAHFKGSKGADFICVNIVSKHTGYVFDDQYNAFWFHYRFKSKLRDASGACPCLRAFYVELTDGLKGGVDFGRKVTDCYMFCPKDGSGHLKKAVKTFPRGRLYLKSGSSKFPLSAEQLVQIQRRHGEDMDKALAQFKESGVADFVFVNICEPI